MQSEHINELAEALAAAQGQIKNPQRNRKVTVVTRTGSKYEFQYADLDAIIDAIKKPLSDNGIGYIQYVEQIEDKFRLVTMLMHKSGQWVSAINPLFLTPQKDRDGNVLPPSSQDFGSAQTFMKRYALAAMTGVAADTDDDANMADGNAAKFAPRVPESVPAIKPPSKAAEALVDIASGVTAGKAPDPKQLADELSKVETRNQSEISGQAWRRFGEQMVKLAREGKGFTPEQQAKMSLMKKEREKMWQHMADAIADAQKTVNPLSTGTIDTLAKPPEAPPQPNPGDDPDAYRVWLIDQLSKYDKAKDLADFYSIQRPLWNPCFPPDIEDWEALFSERTTELK